MAKSTKARKTKKTKEKMKRFYASDWFLPVAIVVAASILAGCVVIYKQQNAPQKLTKQGLAKFVYTCDNSQPNSIDCLQQKYVNSVRSMGIAKTFDQLRKDYAANTAVQSSCHQITHAIGREAAEKYKTIEAAYDHGDNFCWSGFYHGVMEAVARDYGKDHINANLTNICANVAATRKYSFYHFNCVHGLGHGLMAVNEDELFDVLKLCDKYSDNWEQRSCYGGAFMENIMIAIQMGGESKYLKSDQPMYPCTAVDSRYREECYLMQTSQALRVLNNDYATVFELCSKAEGYQNVCYQSLGRDASGNSTSNIEKTISICMLGAANDARENCFVGAVKDFISYHHDDVEAKKLCSALELDLQEVCDSTREEYLKTL